MASDNDYIALERRVESLQLKLAEQERILEVTIKAFQEYSEAQTEHMANVKLILDKQLEMLEQQNTLLEPIHKSNKKNFLI